MDEEYQLSCPECGKILFDYPEDLDRLLENYKELKKELDSYRKNSDYMSGVFVGTMNGDCFHRPECKWVAMAPRKSLVKFYSHEEAVADGRKPCKTCYS